jgi:glycosyltransferase involved in cell wall biosynthesis
MSSDPIPTVEVVVPTRNRPDKLARCLDALARARAALPFPVLVCDSSDEEHSQAVSSVCAQHEFATLRSHSGRNVAGARNACARLASGEVLINVDDDIQVDADAILHLVTGYCQSPKPAVIAGAVAWDGVYSRPIVMRYIGYGRSAREGEPPSFLVGAFFAYSRELALALPWNERIRTSDDRFMGALWRRRGIHLGYAPSAKATHDPEHVTYNVDEQRSHIYANMFDAVLANPELKRAISYEFVGFLVGLRTYARSPSDFRRYVAAWASGNIALIRDFPYLRRMLRCELPLALAADPRGAAAGSS